MKSKIIKKQDEWHKVVNELSEEIKKLQSYDEEILNRLGNIKEDTILDYGSGPGVLAKVLKNLGGNIKSYDISKEMCDQSADKIGQENVYYNIKDIPNFFFDYILCNLVVCIVTEEEVEVISHTIYEKLKENGKAFIGFCNPYIFKVKESNLDFRFPKGNKYEENHDYKKVKKEGYYEIIEKHRPIEWYTEVFLRNNLFVEKLFFTKEYSLNKNKIQDFVIFQLVKRK